MNLRQQPGVRVLACLVDPVGTAYNPGFPTGVDFGNASDFLPFWDFALCFDSSNSFGFGFNPKSALEDGTNIE